MVSNASEDLPDPDSPVITVSVFRGISTSMFLRLCCRAPRITSLVRPMYRTLPPQELRRTVKIIVARITLYNSRRDSTPQIAAVGRSCGPLWNKNYRTFIRTGIPVDALARHV